MRPIHPNLHGLLDYSTVAFLFLSPSLFSLNPIIVTVTYSLAFLQLLLTVFTNFRFGIFKKLPFLIHGYIEFLISFGLAIAAICFHSGDLKAGMILYFSLAAVYLVVFTLTDFSFEKAELCLPGPNADRKKMPDTLHDKTSIQ